MHSLSDYDYKLPETLIAQTPSPRRSDARLLVLDQDQCIHDQDFHQLSQWLQADDLVVINDSAVMKARLRARKPSGGALEVLIERVITARQALAMIGSNKKLAIGQAFQILDQQGSAVCEAVIRERQESLFILEFGQDPAHLMREHGSLPLPPYIGRQPDRDDANRYQTVYGHRTGSVAAPTAGLHFDQPLIARLQSMGVVFTSLTLHVGIGTFSPVRAVMIDQHRMHAEVYELGEDCARAIARAREKGGRVVAVGTTALRTLETCANPDKPGHVSAQCGETRLFIRPGFAFQICEALITNFHLPRSSLLMLVSAFAGFETIQKVYAHAIEKQYRFFSYGDASLLLRKKSLA
jgi:S-adenosylmethionine:tRNA ribosyltransferase-isomerase